MNPAEEHRRRGIRIGLNRLGVLIVIALSVGLAVSSPANKLAITGPLRILSAKLADFDFGSELSTVPSLFGQQAGGKDTSGVDLSETRWGGEYLSLSPQQKRLVDDWFQRLNSTVKKTVDPAEGYAEIPLSARTTFDAVTHALTKTGLTDKSGKKLADTRLSTSWTK